MLCTGHEKFIGTYDEINFNLESSENMVWINEDSLITSMYYYVSPEEKILFFSSFIKSKCSHLKVL